MVLVAGLAATTASATYASMAAQPAPDKDRRPSAWIAAVRAHEPGKIDPALLTVAAWTPGEVERILPQIAAEPDAAQLLARGLMLHADIGFAEHAGAARGGGLPVMMLEDGRATGNRRLSLQWRIGRTIASVLVGLGARPQDHGAPPTPVDIEREARRRVVRAWYRATSAFLQEEGHLGFVQTQAGAGLSLLGDDPVLLMYRATIRQGFADPRIQQFVRTRRWQSRSLELTFAGRDLRRALELDPELVEARIRLGHVLGDQGHHQEATELLRPAMASALPQFLEYYGSLVLGRAEERSGRLPEARAAYERAARAFPAAQAPRVALSRLTLIDGRASDALATLLADSPARESEPPEDPWWWYFKRHEPDARALIAAMREVAR
jgi:hypothetical protein